MNYKKFRDLKLSEIGIGTYLGNIDQETDQGYYQTIKKGVELGINVIDTAINYRNMRSEKVIGKVLSEIERDKVVVSTKGGYLTSDADYKGDPNQWIREELIETGILNPKDMTAYGNVLTPQYIDWAFNKSLSNLSTDYIDVYFLHNPEDQLTKFSREEFYKKLRTVFRLLEGKVQEGKLKYYGLATWSGFRVPPEHQQYLNLSEIFQIAKEVGGEEHHFRFIQLPYNLGMLEAFKLKNQNVDGWQMSTLEAAQKLGIYTYISATLFQGKVVRPTPPQIKQLFKVEKDVHVSIQFVRSTPRVGTALIGMSKPEHLIENIEIENYPYLTKEELLNIIEPQQKG